MSADQKARIAEARESLRIAVASEAERRRLPPECSDALNAEFQRCADLMDKDIFSWGHCFEFLATWIKGRAPRKPSAVRERKAPKPAPAAAVDAQTDHAEPCPLDVAMVDAVNVARQWAPRLTPTERQLLAVRFAEALGVQS